MRMPAICPQMPNVELKGALPDVLFLFIAGGFGRNANKMPTKIGVLYEFSRGVASATVQNRILSCCDALVNPRETA